MISKWDQIHKIWDSCILGLKINKENGQDSGHVKTACTIKSHAFVSTTSSSKDNILVKKRLSSLA